MKKDYSDEFKKAAIDTYFLNIKNNVVNAAKVTAQQFNMSTSRLKKWVADERRRMIK
jgi:transposase-like protein